MVGKGGRYGNVIRLAPPMTLTAQEADEALDILTQSIAAVAKLTAVPESIAVVAESTAGPELSAAVAESAGLVATEARSR